MTARPTSCSKRRREQHVALGRLEVMDFAEASNSCSAKPADVVLVRAAVAEAPRQFVGGIETARPLVAERRATARLRSR